MENLSLGLSGNFSLSNEIFNIRIPTRNIVIIATWSFGAITSLINLLVFVKILKKDLLYKFLLIMCAADFLYLSTFVFMYIYRIFCDGRLIQSECSTTAKYIDLFNELVIDEYFTSCLAIFNISMEIYLTLDRLFLVTQVKIFKNFNSNIIIIIIGIFASLYYFPLLFIYQIQEIRTNLTINSLNYTITYDITKTNYGNSKIGILTPTILSLIIITIVTFILFSLNILNIIKYKKYFDQKIKKSTYQSKIFVFL